MDSSQRDRIDQLYRAALTKPAQERDSFLTETCAGNPELRREVDARLAQADSDVTETLVIAGTSVGPYEILGPLGAGGMGEVFRARDPRLGRPVAIKFLSRATVADRATLERFRREAQAISALNHPNVCTIYDIGEQDGRPYLVMELLDGQTLKQRIASSGFSNDQILGVALPILEALEAAHAAGIVHRDIKPANIFLTTQGVVKILDFGLAKTTGPARGAEEETLTVPGTTLGTAAYMSPEQVRGEAVDARADLFSCGVVLYEMATGKRPFESEGYASTVNAVLSQTPRPPRELNRDLLPEIERLIERALEKDPAARYQTAADLRSELVRIKRQLEAQRAPVSPSKTGHSSALRYAAAGVAILLAVAAAAWYLRSPRGPVTSPSEYVQLTKFNDTATAPALSPDGRMVAFFRGGQYFLSTGQIYVKLLPDGESKQLTDDPRLKYDPVFTPDGSRIAYSVLDFQRRSWDTWTVPVLGGQPTRLMPNAVGLSWVKPGRILFSEVMSGSALHMGIVTAQESRAEEREIYFPNHERAMAHYSWPSPDQRSILVVEMDRTAAWQRCRVVPMAGSTPGTQVGPDGGCFAAAWSPEGKWMYFNVEVDNATHLWRQRVPDGKPEQITFGPSEEEGLAVEPDGKSLITSIGNRQSSVWTHDSSGDHALPLEGSAFHAMLSPDGKRLFFLRRQGASPNENELWSRDLASGRSDALVTGQSIQNFFLSPDQTLVAFSVREGNASQIFLAPLDRSSPPRLVAQGGDIVTMSSGGDLIFRQLGEKANYLARIHPDGSGLERILDTPIAERFGASPDGEWVSVSGFAQAEGTFATGTFGVSTKDHLRRRICTGICVVSWSSKGDYLYVSTDRPSTSVGQTLVIPIPHGFGALALPEAGLDRVPEEQIPGLRVIQRGNLYPGPDPGTYTFTTESFQGNLFRVPLH